VCAVVLFSLSLSLRAPWKNVYIMHGNFTSPSNSWTGVHILYVCACVCAYAYVNVYLQYRYTYIHICIYSEGVGV